MMKTIAAAVGFLLMAAAIGCTPSVRYTRGEASGGSDSPPPGRPGPGVGAGDGGRSGWEASGGVDGGGRPADWLSAALSEADRGVPEASGGANGKGAQQRLTRVVNSYLGVPYRYGGTTRNGFDCSGFVSAVYREVYGVTLKRTSGAMWREGVAVSLSAARPGDLVFFKGGTFGTIDHVGIYMGRSRFAHSSTTSGVIYSNVRETYYARRFAGVRRML